MKTVFLLFEGSFLAFSVVSAIFLSTEIAIWCVLIAIYWHLWNMKR